MSALSPEVLQTLILSVLFSNMAYFSVGAFVSLQFVVVENAKEVRHKHFLFFP